MVSEIAIVAEVILAIEAGGAELFKGPRVTHAHVCRFSTSNITLTLLFPLPV